MTTSAEFAEDTDTSSPKAQVIITGRNVEVPNHFADRVKGKLAKIERLDPTVTSFHVELQKERNPRRESESDRIQITATSKNHIARAEAKEDSFYAALETALAKMERSLRKVKVRRTIARSGHRVPPNAAAVAIEIAQDTAAPDNAGDPFDHDPYADSVDDITPGRVVRTKEHDATPMTVDEALSQMELVGHDFYLFVNSEDQRPSVVYRRHAYDYGLISLVTDDSTS